MSKTTQGITEYEVEYGDMLNEDDYGDITVDCYTSRVLAVARYRQLVKQNKYDSVDLVERSGVVDGCCACSDDIMSYRKENPSYEEEEEICPSCGDEWTEATRCDCPNSDP
tara:strand:- start:63 stop:395 length:333 start_codon:yes stop_codon:yes gene_type:complete